jgi:hypothetical protein
MESTLDLHFEVIVGFDFYEGVETGMAVYPSGQALWITSLGDSHSRRFRAFELAEIEGSWLATLESLRGSGPKDDKVFVGKSGRDMAKLNQLRRETENARRTKLWVFAGSPYLVRGRTAKIDPANLRALQQHNGSPEGFSATLRFIQDRHLLSTPRNLARSGNLHPA